MAPKRKRAVLDAFDPNKSDPEDENFDPKIDQPRKSTKRSRPSRSRRTGSSRRTNRYAGSDVEDDDDEISDSEQDSLGVSEDDDDDDDGEVNASGRRSRKVTTQRKNYKESSEDDAGVDDNEDESDDQGASNHPPTPPKRRRATTTPSPKQTRRMVTLRMTPGVMASIKANPSPTRRVTRARTQDPDDLVELTTSGHHAQPVRSTKSKSPETLLRGRPTRATKGLKRAPEPISEGTQESSIRHTPDDDEDELAGDPDEVVMKDEHSESDDGLNGKTVEYSTVDADLTAADATIAEGEDEDADGTDDESMAAAAEEAGKDGDDEDEEEEVGPRRRTRNARNAVSADPEGDSNEADADADGESRPRRLTRRASTKKSLREPSSDFEPGDESGDAEDVHSSPTKNVDDSLAPRGRRNGRNKTSSKASRSQRNDSVDELELDQDELAEELHELRQSSRQRRRRRSSTPIMYQEKSRRSTAKKVDYRIVPLSGINPEEDEADEPAVTTPGPARRRGGVNTGWDRSLNTTYGPFGGGGAGSLLGGPWGTGAAAGAESDSSDDETNYRTNIGGNVGMTPTTANHPNILPSMGQHVNLDGAGGGTGSAPNVGKIKNQKALADADPIGVDVTADFSKVGGLEGHIDQLKEMVQLPLLYPELFQKFHVTPPRGVLFHGPPGTGKTLLARALANSASSHGRKITFYMRKGADALSKWVGEAEKQLRLLFEEARRTQPSIIFFDEIDGLAPVRSSKQEQIHASIVSTLLALMDGMDGRGQVIVIGATNRPDNIDPALRRPGRFDREFYFPLPDVDGRRSILDIHTKDWGLSDRFKHMIAESTKGCGGADLRALCTEATLNSIQRTYPQIYASKEKLVVDPSKITVQATDFLLALKKLVPSSERSTSSGARPLPAAIEPLLRDQFDSIKRRIESILPRGKKITALEEAMYEPFNDADGGFARETLNQEFERSRVFRPRLLIHGSAGMGQNYIASAILHHLEGVHVQNFDLPNLLSDGRPMEQVIVAQFNEIKRHKPSVIFVPNIDSWYECMHDSLGLRTFTAMLRAIPSTDPVLLLATSDMELSQLHGDLRSNLFGYSANNNLEIARPGSSHRREFFTPIVRNAQKSPNDFPDPTKRKKRILEELEVAPAPPPKPASREEQKAAQKRDRQLLNLLKVNLQPIMDQINRKYKKFRQPVIAPSQLHQLFAESEPGYVRPDVSEETARPFEIAKDKHGIDVLLETATGKLFYNLETTTIEERLSNGFYARPGDFLFDIRTLARDAKNIGDKERTLKANELLSNVEVDVAAIESTTGHVNWEELYQRQLHRAREATEKERKRREALEQREQERTRTLSQPRSALGGNDSDSQGPVTLGEAIPGSRLTTARFQLKALNPANGSASGRINGGDGKNNLGGGGAHHDSSGLDLSHNSTHGEIDVEMSGTFEAQESSSSQMRPPSIMTQSVVRNAHLSQRSAVMSLPSGVSPSAIANDASTTRTTDLSSNKWTPSTNGYHDDVADDTQRSGQADSQNTVPAGNSQDTVPSLGTSGSLLGNSQHTVPSLGTSGSLPGNSSHGSCSRHGHGNGNTPPISGQRSSVANSVANLDARPSMDGLSSQLSSSSARNSGSSQSQQMNMIFVDEASARVLLDHLTEKTSGLAIEQLEQVNRELMHQIWETRGEWNRNKVLNRLTMVFNETLSDIKTQGLIQLSQ